MSEEKQFDGDGESSEIHDASQFLSEDSSSTEELTVEDIINATEADLIIEGDIPEMIID